MYSGDGANTGHGIVTHFSGGIVVEEERTAQHNTNNCSETIVQGPQ